MEKTTLNDNQKTCCQSAQPETNSEENNALQQCKAHLEEWRERYLRVQADLDNFSRRIEKEKASWMKTAQAHVFKELLPIVDDFERATLNQPQDENLQKWVEGFELIAKAMKKMLLAQGVEEITQVQVFDPLLHEALMQVESADHASGTIVQVLQKGYMFKGEVMRPAKVSVAR